MSSSACRTPSCKVAAGPLAIVLVGLPARGKTFIARHLSKYLQWLGVKTQTISVAHYRRKLCGSQLSHDFYDPNNKEAWEKRSKISDQALKEMVDWFNEGGQVGIFDAANITEDRRQKVLDVLTASSVKVIFLEAICDNQEIIDCNIRESKVLSPEYQGMTEEDASVDYLKRIEIYKKIYQEIPSNSSLSFIKLINLGEQIIVSNLEGYLQSRILFYLMNLNVRKRFIYLFQSGPCSQDCSTIRHNLEQWLEQRQSAPLVIWSSTEPQCLELIEGICYKVQEKPQLCKLNNGTASGMTISEIMEKFPVEYKEHIADQYHHRFSRGESYHDLVIRLESIILELEREKNDILIIADASVLRCIYAFFANIPGNDIPKLIFEDYEIRQMIPKAYGVVETRDVLSGSVKSLKKNEFIRYREDY